MHTTKFQHIVQRSNEGVMRPIDDTSDKKVVFLAYPFEGCWDEVEVTFLLYATGVESTYDVSVDLGNGDVFGPLEMSYALQCCIPHFNAWAKKEEIQIVGV